MEVPYDLALHQSATGLAPDGVAVVASPIGQEPTVLNTRILQVDVGLTASGRLVATFPVSIGPLSDFRLSIVYFVNQAGVIFQTVNPATGQFEDNYSGLKMGLWENGFDSNGLVKDNFIDLDPDRFRLKIEDATAAGDGEIFATLEIDAVDDAYDDDPDTVRLLESGSEAGVFYSEAMLLVSDDEDDDHKAYATGPSSEGGSQPRRRTDNEDYDRTHLAQLGAMVRVEYDGETAVHAIPAKHRVTVNIVNFKGSGTNFNTIRAAHRYPMNRRKTTRSIWLGFALLLVAGAAPQSVAAGSCSTFEERNSLMAALEKLESEEELEPAEQRRFVKEVESWYPCLRRKIKETEGAKGHGPEHKLADRVYYFILRIGRLARNRDLDLNTRPLVRLLEDIVSGRIDIVDYKGGMVGQAVSLQALFKDRSDFTYFIRILKTHPNDSARLNALTTLGDMGDASDADLVEQAVREMEPIPLSKEVPPGEGVTLQEWHDEGRDMHEGLIREAFLDVIPAMRRKGVSNE